ncbi:hypothetical protein Aperf_G00000090051 [Anoplocephala perfoliata]
MNAQALTVFRELVSNKPTLNSSFGEIELMGDAFVERRSHWQPLVDQSDSNGPEAVPAIWSPRGSHFNRFQRTAEPKSSPSRGDGSSSSFQSTTSNRNLVNYSDTDLFSACEVLVVKELAHLDPFLFSPMFYRLLIGRNIRFLHLSASLRRAFSTEAETVDIYVAANRAKFYRTLGIFTLVQGVAWFAFAKYLFSRRNEKLTWKMIKNDFYKFNHLIADRLESWTPEAVKKLILRPRKIAFVEEPTVSTADKAQPELVESVVNSEEIEKEESDMKRFANKVREAFGVDRVDHGNEDIKSRHLVPYICFIMGAFTLFVGAFIPRRVIRRISMLPMKPSGNTANSAVLHPGNYDPIVQVTTYGWFGTFPRRGGLITTPISSIRATVGYREGAKFMNLLIGRRPFVFYLEHSEAEFLLPEYFEHLKSTATSSKK